MDSWEILGIEETFDKTEIKRAYARKAKLYHPEEHPKEYQRLRSAYRMAVKLAEESKKAMEIDAGVPVGENHGQPEIVIGNGSQAETVPDMQAEENRTQMWEDDTEKPSEGENPYNYEEVASYVSKENEEQFFLEFELLMENPCLTNQINCFRALFSREEYRSLFSDAGVCRKLGERILTCKNFGSHMLDFFETYLADDDPDSILKQKEWRRLRKAAATTAQKDISITAGPEEIDEHQWILYRLRSAGYAGLTTQKAAELYLEQYLPWAKEHREELAAFRKKKRKQYLAWNIGVVAGVFGAVFLFWFLVA